MSQPVALITGSSRGLGRVVALRFARGGWNVVVNCVRSADGAAAVGTEAESLGAETIVVQGDVAEDAVQGELIDAAMRRWGRLDCLVNNAGVDESKPLSKLGEETWDRIIAVDLLGPIGLIRRAAAVMRPGSSVVNVCSMCGVWGCPGASAYSAAKSALAALAPGMASQLRRKGIRINGVAPGYMPTDMGSSFPAAMEAARSRHAMGALADPQGAAEFIFQLTQMPQTTGQLFILDGRIR